MIQLREQLQNKVEIISNLLDFTLPKDNWNQETKFFSKVVAEKSFNVELLTQSLLDYFSCVEKNALAFYNPWMQHEFVSHLIHRMSQNNLIELRHSLMSILNSLLQSKTYHPDKIQFGLTLFAYLDVAIPLIEEDNFNYLNTLFPMLVNWDFAMIGDERRRLLSIIGWQLINKNHALPDDDCLNDVNHHACVMIKLLAAKTKEVYQAYHLANETVNDGHKKMQLK